MDDVAAESASSNNPDRFKHKRPYAPSPPSTQMNATGASRPTFGRPVSRQPSSPLATQSTPSTSSTPSSSQGPSVHQRLQVINRCYHLLTSTCAACYVTATPMTFSHTVNSCERHFANTSDEGWRNFRTIFRNFRGGCFGCSVPNNVSRKFALSLVYISPQALPTDILSG
jgi:hypothetical protein